MIREVVEKQKALREEGRRLYAASDLLSELVQKANTYFIVEFLSDTRSIRNLQPMVDKRAEDITALLRNARVLGLEKIFPEPVHMPFLHGITCEINVPSFLLLLREQFPEPNPETQLSQP